MELYRMTDENYNLKIPIKNFYYMLSYSFGVLNQGGYAELGSEDFHNIYDLMSEILIKGIESQLKRGIYKEYIPFSEPLNVLRGKVIISDSIKLKTMSSNKLACSFDDFCSDNFLNQILKSTCFVLLKNKGVKDINRKKLKQLMMYFGEVKTLTIHSIAWSQVRYHKNNMTYKMLMNICFLVCEGLLVTEESGKYKFADYIKDKLMSSLYEKFVYEFFRKECPDLTVAYQQQINWQITEQDGIGGKGIPSVGGIDTAGETRGEGEKNVSDAGSEFDGKVCDGDKDNGDSGDGEYSGNIDLLPKMNTDISLTKGNHRLIIDTKFYPDAMQKNYLGDKKTLISGNLYQIFAYVKNSEFKGKVSGMLLYPTVEYDLSERYRLGGNDVYIRTLDLSKEFVFIKEQLIKVGSIL
jgi:5-methylcytosine-specific restriction enzyme subunit McrC